MDVADQEIAINKCFGGFGLSYEAVMKYAELKGIELYGYVNVRDDKGSMDFDKYELYDPEKDCKGWLCIHYSKKPLDTSKKETQIKVLNENYFSVSDISRDDPDLIKAIRACGESANGNCADISIVKIPAGVEWAIEEYDGQEWIAEKHRTWG